MNRDNLLAYVTENELNQVQVSEDDWKVIDPEEFLDKHYDSIVEEYVKYKKENSHSIWILEFFGEFVTFFSEKPTKEQVMSYVKIVHYRDPEITAEEILGSGYCGDKFDWALYQAWEGEDLW